MSLLTEPVVNHLINISRFNFGDLDENIAQLAGAVEYTDCISAEG